jgi:flagellar hook protein FlgE
LVNGSGYRVLNTSGTAIRLPVAPNDIRPGSANTKQIDVIGFNQPLSPYGTVSFGGLTYTNTNGASLSASDVASIFTGLSAGATGNPLITSGTFSGALGNYNTEQNTENIPDTYLGQDITEQQGVSWVQATATGFGPQPTILVSASGFITGSMVMVATQTPGTLVALLDTMAIDATGTIIGTYSDGLTNKLGQIGVASIPSYTGLKEVGNTIWMQTTKSGTPTIGTARSAGSSIKGSAVEGSNVNQTTDMVALLAAQQAYQASAQTIKINDQMYQTLIAMNG